jgi:hypothetical protein
MSKRRLVWELTLLAAVFFAGAIAASTLYCVVTGSEWTDVGAVISGVLAMLIRIIVLLVRNS